MNFYFIFVSFLYFIYLTFNLNFFNSLISIRSVVQILKFSLMIFNFLSFDSVVLKLLFPNFGGVFRIKRIFLTRSESKNTVHLDRLIRWNKSNVLYKLYICFLFFYNHNYSLGVWVWLLSKPFLHSCNQTEYSQTHFLFCVDFWTILAFDHGYHLKPNFALAVTNGIGICWILALHKFGRASCVMFIVVENGFDNSNSNSKQGCLPFTFH